MHMSVIRDDYNFTMDHARRDREGLDKLISETTSISMRCSVCNELLVFEDKSIDPPNRVWGVSPCEVCMAKVKSSIKAFTTALKELTDE